jgi:hypothetical protein
LARYVTPCSADSHLHGWVGIDVIYDFTRNPQRGLDEYAGEILRRDPARTEFVAASKPGGRLR